MSRQLPSALQSFCTGIGLPVLSLSLLPFSLSLVTVCVWWNRFTASSGQLKGRQRFSSATQRCVIISGGRMSKGLHLARAFHRAGWKVIGVEETGWGELCPMRFSTAVDQFYLIPSPTSSFKGYISELCSIAVQHSAELFIPVSGVASSVEDAQVAGVLGHRTRRRCTTFIQDEETMEDLHDKQKFMDLAQDLDMLKPRGQRITSVNEAIQYLKDSPSGSRPAYVLKCLGVDENRGDLTLYPLDKDDKAFGRTRTKLEKLSTPITTSDPYVFQEFISGQEFCTHASVIDGCLTSFVACPSNDMLMTYEDATNESAGLMAREWTSTFLDKLQALPTKTGKKRRLTGHFSFDFILSNINGQLYPIECNARVHTAVILLPLSHLAACYDRPGDAADSQVLQPVEGTITRSWIYNDIIMQYLPTLIPSRRLLGLVHPSLPPCIPRHDQSNSRPSTTSLSLKVDPTITGDDWVPFLIFWHVFWPLLLLGRWWDHKPWTRVNVSTGRIFGA